MRNDKVIKRDETEKKFVVGREYFARSVCDHETLFTITITKRTEKSVWFTSYGEDARMTLIKFEDDGTEYIIPERFSMCPVYRATRFLEEEKQETEEPEENLAMRNAKAIQQKLIAGQEMFEEHGKIVDSFITDFSEEVKCVQCYFADGYFVGAFVGEYHVAMDCMHGGESKRYEPVDLSKVLA